MGVNEMKLLKFVILFLAIVVSALFAVAQSNGLDSPAVVSAVAPAYPPIARTANASGDATVEVDINREGKVTSVESKGGHPILRKAAEEAARRWLFSPATTDRNRKATLTFSFRMVPAKSPIYDGTSVYYPPYKIEARAIEAIVNP
jgi:TonB family protein